MTRLSDQTWRQVCHFPATKPRKRLIEVEGELEKDYCYHLEFSTDVVGYEPQPESISYILDGETRTYTPDFSVLYSDKTIHLVEIKFEEFVTEDVIRVLDAVAEKVAVQGIKVRLVTEKDIRKEPRYSNITDLFHAKSIEVIDQSIVSKIIQYLQSSSTASISELINTLGFVEGLGLFHKLLCEGVIVTDFDKYFIDLNCPVWLSDKYV